VAKIAKKSSSTTGYISQLPLGVAFGIITAVIQISLVLTLIPICSINYFPIIFPIVFPFLFILIANIILKKYFDYNYKFFLIAFIAWFAVWIITDILVGLLSQNIGPVGWWCPTVHVLPQ
jgi:hypothetical protein